MTGRSMAIPNGKRRLMPHDTPFTRRMVVLNGAHHKIAILRAYF